MTSTNHFTTLVLVTTFLSCFVFNTSFAQSKKSGCSGFQDTILHKYVYKTVDQQPEPFGGMEKLLAAMQNIQGGPSANAEIRGRIILAFVVEKNGEVDGFRVVKGIKSSNQLFEIIKKYKWRPGLCNGIRVPVLVSIPIIIDVSE